MTAHPADSLATSGLAARLVYLDWIAAHEPEDMELERGLVYPPHRPRPLNLDLCSSCEVGSHDLCPTRLGGSGWQPAYYCACLCRYADQGAPAPRRKPAPARTIHEGREVADYWSGRIPATEI